MFLDGNRYKVIGGGQEDGDSGEETQYDQMEPETNKGMAGDGFGKMEPVNGGADEEDQYDTMHDPQCPGTGDGFDKMEPIDDGGNEEDQYDTMHDPESPKIDQYDEPLPGGSQENAMEENYDLDLDDQDTDPVDDTTTGPAQSWV